MEYITRQEAKAQGLTRYRLKEPCKHGHFSTRFTSTKNCTECLRLWKIAHATPRKERLAPSVEELEWRAQRNRDRATQWAKDNRVKYLARLKEWRAANVEARRAGQKQWRTDNKERHRATQERWAKKNPEKVIASRSARFHRRRARMLKAGGTFTPKDVISMRKKQKGRCAECKAKKRLTVDHIVPIARGGSNHVSNLQLLCQPCNSRKSDKDPIAWAQEKGRLL